MGFNDAAGSSSLAALPSASHRVTIGRRLRIELAQPSDEETERVSALLRDHPGVLSVRPLPDHLEVAVNDEVEDEQLLSALVEKKVRVRSFSQVAGDLSEAFMRLTEDHRT